MPKNAEISKRIKPTRERIPLKKRTARLILKLIDKYLDWEQKEAWKKGVITSCLLWLLFVIVEICDEKLADVGCLYAWFIVFLGPPTVCLDYCFAYIRDEYTYKDGLVRIMSYIGQCLINFLLIVFLMSVNLYPAEQIKRPDGGDYNGIEFLIFLIISVTEFLIPVVIYHIGLYIIRKIKKIIYNRKTDSSNDKNEKENEK